MLQGKVFEERLTVGESSHWTNLGEGEGRRGFKK